MMGSPFFIDCFFAKNLILKIYLHSTKIINVLLDILENLVYTDSKE